MVKTGLIFETLRKSPPTSTSETIFTAYLLGRARQMIQRLLIEHSFQVRLAQQEATDGEGKLAVEQRGLPSGKGGKR